MKIVLLAAAAAFALPTAASATEVFAGLHAHGVKTPLSLDSDREGGADVSVGIRGNPVLWKLQPYAFGQLNTDGGTNFLAAGLSARFGDKLYVRPGVGLAIHDGSASKVDLPDRLALRQPRPVRARNRGRHPGHRPDRRGGELDPLQPCPAGRPAEPRDRQYRRAAERPALARGGSPSASPASDPAIVSPAT